MHRPTKPTSAHVEIDPSWNPFLLKFKRESTEKEFRRVIYPAFLAQDLVALYIELICGPLITFIMGDVLPLWNLSMWWTYTLVIAPIFIYTHQNHPSVFKRYRSAIIFFIRLVMLIGHVKFSLYLEVPKASFTAIIFLIMTRSPLPSMVFMAMSHRLEFRNHLILQSIALIEAIFWIPPFCKTCSTNNTVMNTFTKMGNGIDCLLSPSIFDKIMDYRSSPCWSVSFMIIMMMGFLIPNFIVYLTEVSSRSMFLEMRASDSAKKMVKENVQSAHKMALIVLSAFPMGIWFCLSLFHE